MKIGVLSTSYPRHETDIAGCFVRDANREFAQRGHQVEVLIPEGELSRQNGSDDPTTVIEIPYLRPRSLQRTFHGSGVINNIASNPMRAIGALSFLPNLALKARQSAHHWDAIVSHWCLPCGLIGGQLATDLPHLVIFHSADVQLLEKLPLRRQLAAAILHGASALHFVAAHLKARFFALLPI